MQEWNKETLTLSALDWRPWGRCHSDSWSTWCLEAEGQWGEASAHLKRRTHDPYIDNQLYWANLALHFFIDADYHHYGDVLQYYCICIFTATTHSLWGWTHSELTFCLQVSPHCSTGLPSHHQSASTLDLSLLSWGWDPDGEMSKLRRDVIMGMDGMVVQWLALSPHIIPIWTGPFRERKKWQIFTSCDGAYFLQFIWVNGAFYAEWKVHVPLANLLRKWSDQWSCDVFEMLIHFSFVFLTQVFCQGTLIPWLPRSFKKE